VESTGEWELGHSRIDLTPIGKKLFKTDEDHIHLHQMHQDHVTSPPSHKTTDLLNAGDKVHVWGKSPHTEVQGLYVRNRVFTTQAHM
jgi:GMP synthase-like glutamine amidotransferase